MTDCTADKQADTGRKTTGMARAGWKEIVLLTLCVSISCGFSLASRLAAGGRIKMIDFGNLYFCTRGALQHHDPYDTSQMLQALEAGGRHFAADRTSQEVNKTVLTRGVYLPTALLVAVPFALLPWGIAQNVWMLLTAALLVTAAFLTFDLGAGATPLMWAGLAGFMLAESDLLLGNPAAMVISFCVIAAWCFLKDRHVWIGILLPARRK